MQRKISFKWNKNMILILLQHHILEDYLFSIAILQSSFLFSSFCLKFKEVLKMLWMILENKTVNLNSSKMIDGNRLWKYWYFAFKCMEQGFKINFISCLQWSHSMDSIESHYVVFVCIVLYVEPLQVVSLFSWSRFSITKFWNCFSSKF
jgi:hypothetical protein